MVASDIKIRAARSVSSPESNDNLMYYTYLGVLFRTLTISKSYRLDLVGQFSVGRAKSRINEIRAL